MKKLIFSILCGAALSMTGCMDKIPDPSPVQPGYNIYSVAMLQNTMALEPANVAFRLFILLSEARNQGITDLSNESLSEIKVQIDKNTPKLKTILFGSSAGDGYSYGSIVEQTSPDSGVWSIYYPPYDGYYVNNYDRYVSKSGYIYIDTGGKMLDEPSAEWMVYTDENVNKHFVIHTSYELHNTIDQYSYYITNNGDNSWDINGRVSSYDSRSTDNVADWDLYFRLTALPASTSASAFDRMYGAKYELSGSGTGGSIYWPVDYFQFGYSVSPYAPLGYKLSCDGYMPVTYKGTVECELIDYSNGALGNDYPAKTVDLTWSENTTDPCKTAVTINYNGHTEIQ